jgi:hypothetical protein
MSESESINTFKLMREDRFLVTYGLIKMCVPSITKSFAGFNFTVCSFPSETLKVIVTGFPISKLRAYL